MSYLGIAAGAALSWCHDGNRQTDFARELDTHVFRDRAGVMGGLARDLGNAYLRTGLRAESLAETRRWIEEVAAHLDGARMDLPDAALLGAAGDSCTRERIVDIIGEYRRLWVARNRIGGLAQSVKKLEALIPGAG